MKIFKNKFLSSTFILILSGMSTKLLGLLIKVIFTRIVEPQTIGLYTLVMPTYSLLLTISSFAMPTTIAKLTAEENNSWLLNNALVIILIINFIIVFALLILSPFIAKNLLNNIDTYPLLIAMAITIPFASIACILKGYFYGKQKMIPHVVSNTIEQIIRLLLVLVLLPRLVKISYIHAAVGLITTSLFTELASIVTFLIYMPKKEVINMSKLKINKVTTNKIFTLSLPIVGSKVIANIGYFLEPIVLTKILLCTGYSKNYIMMEYGYYNAYAIATLSIPSFFISAISLSLLPEISKNLSNKALIKRRIIEGFTYALIIGIFSSSFILIFRKPLLNILYNSINGADYIKVLAPIFTLFYLEAIFSSILESFGKTKEVFNITTISAIIKIIFMLIFGLLKKGIYSLIYSEILNIIIVIILDAIYTRKALKSL